MVVVWASGCLRLWVQKDRGVSHDAVRVQTGEEGSQVALLNGTGELAGLLVKVQHLRVD